VEQRFVEGIEIEERLEIDPRERGVESSRLAQSTEQRIDGKHEKPK
jgi:hypothetical protein